MALFSKLTQRFRSSYLEWVNRRVPRARSVTLDQRRIFIFPSRPGLWFACVLMIMLLAAINFQNSMAFALVFLMVSMFVVTILHTYANLSGLSITAVRALPAFAGDRMDFEVLVSRSSGRAYFDVMLFWEEGVSATVTLKDTSESLVRLHLPTHKRGVFEAKRLLVETFYPLGLLRAWTWIALDFDALVYPKPLEGKLQPPADAGGDDGEVTAKIGSDDFHDFKSYQAGDSLKHVFWKSYAKGQSLQTKQYQSYAERRLWLDWEQFLGDVEMRLSQMCFWVLTLDRNNELYGVRLPGIEIQPATGEQHKTLVLQKLALFSLHGGGAG
jgi:uncharacterized protein (DUF58 family)